MDEYLKEFTKRIITEAEAEVELENRKNGDKEKVDKDKSLEKVDGNGDVKPHYVDIANSKIKATEKNNVIEETSIYAQNDGHIPRSKKKRRAPPPPTHYSLASTKNDQENKMSTKVEVTSTRAASTPTLKTNQISGQDGENKEKNEAKSSASRKSMGSSNLEESASDLSLGNPFHPLYELHTGQLQKHASNVSINVSDSCSEFSLSNPFHPDYDETTGTISLTESESELSLSNPFNPHYTEIVKVTNDVKAGSVLSDILDEIGEGQEELDKFDDQTKKKKKGFVGRVKRLFALMIPCLRKKTE